MLNSIKKTGKVLLLQEDSQFSGYMGEISSCISEEIFEYLDAPIVRVGSLDTPIPFAKDLEKGYMAKNRLKERLDYILKYWFTILYKCYIRRCPTNIDGNKFFAAHRVTRGLTTDNARSWTGQEHADRSAANHRGASSTSP